MILFSLENADLNENDQLTKKFVKYVHWNRKIYRATLIQPTYLENTFVSNFVFLIKFRNNCQFTSIVVKMEHLQQK